MKTIKSKFEGEKSILLDGADAAAKNNKRGDANHGRECCTDYLLS